jgi:hypothetical protein
MTGKLIRPAPAEIEFKNMRFLITEQPQVEVTQNELLSHGSGDENKLEFLGLCQCQGTI